MRLTRPAWLAAWARRTVTDALTYMFPPDEVIAMMVGSALMTVALPLLTYYGGLH